jgi:hypothetical protein
MRAPVVQIQRKAKAGYQKVLKIREECEMRFTIGMAKVNRWLPESFTKKSSVKLLGGLAVGAMLITATTFTYDQLRRDEAASPSSSSQIAEASQALAKNFVGIAYPSSENSQGLQAPAYWVQRDEIKHLESQIASLLADAARDPSRNTPQLNRKIERLDYQIDMMGLYARRNNSVDRLPSSYPVACDVGGYALRHESFDEAWQNLLGRPPSSQPTACEIDQYALRQELEESLYNEMWKEQESR